MPDVTRTNFVEEFHGPYGPYHVSELVLQKIWMEEAFDVSRLRDERGRLVEVVFPGKWNRLEGPDFKDAILRLDGVEVRGDVEVHFSQSDWLAHGHDGDARYDGVVLHVLYYDPGREARAARTSAGHSLPRVALLPLLWFSLEEYAGDDSLIASTGVDLRPEVERLLELDGEERRSRLIGKALRRWKMKCHYASRRIETLGWQGACHQSALEVMGFARNRVPMLMIAERHGLEDFSRGDLEVEGLMAIGGERWRFNGCRPANHPKLRLRQYLQLATDCPGWPEALLAFGAAAGREGESIAAEDWGSVAARRGMRVSELRNELIDRILGGILGGAKADTLACDALLPLLAARLDFDGFGLWFHWNAGNGPASCLEALRVLQVLEQRKVPMSNGWLQGMLGARTKEEPVGSGEAGFQAHA